MSGRTQNLHDVYALGTLDRSCAQCLADGQKWRSGMRIVSPGATAVPGESL
jgi:hypothetical protein